MTTNPDSEEQFFAAVGRTVAAWSALEYLMCQWFIKLLKDSPTSGKTMSLLKVFSSARNFNTKRDLLEAAALSASTGSEQEFLVTAIKKASQYSAFRNKVAHDLYIKDGNRMQIQPHKMVFEAFKPIVLQDLLAAQTWIDKLKNIMARTLADNGITPEEGLLQIEELPNEADHPLNAPIPPKGQQRAPRKRH